MLNLFLYFYSKVYEVKRVQVCWFLFFFFLCPLTSPPSTTSWSSVTMRTMLLAFALDSAHLTRQMSSADISTVTAAEAPLRRLVEAPVLIFWTAIGSPEHQRTHAQALGCEWTQWRKRCRTLETHAEFEEVKLIIWSERRRRSDGSEHRVQIRFT